jgi:uncharacterized protein YndB with AHSA1/START domain
MTSSTLSGTLSRALDGTAEVSFDRVYDTDTTDLWQAVTDPERLARWFAPVEGDLAVGGQFTIKFDDNNAPGCRLTACDAPRSFTWEWPHETHSSVITVEVLPNDATARLRLTHTHLTSEQGPEYAAGWDAYVNRLGDHVAGNEVQDTWFEDFGRTKDGYAAQLA